MMATRRAIGWWTLVTVLVLPHDAPAVQSKCLAGKTKCAATHLTKVLKCHQLAETPGRSPDPNAGGCIDKALLKLDGGSTPAKGCVEKLEGKTPNDCIIFDDTFAIADAVATCVDAVVAALDPAPPTQRKCGAGKKKCAAKMLKGLLKCHQLAQTPRKPDDPNAKSCLDKVRLKFDGGLEPDTGCFEKLEAKDPEDCETLDDTAALEGVLDHCVADLVALIATPATTSTSSSTSSSSTSTTSTSATPTTSTSSSTSTTAPASTTTSTTAGPTTTSTSSTTSSSTSTSTSSTTSPMGCGNGTTAGGETCDDGNHSDNDSCPADCRIAACTPLTTTQRFVSVRFAPPEGGLVAGMTVLLDYPEGNVDLPGNGTTLPSGTISGVPTGAFVSVNDLNFGGLGHAARITVGAGSALPPGQFVRLRFQDCQGAAVPPASAFPCTMLSASDPFLNPVNGVQCLVVVE